MFNYKHLYRYISILILVLVCIIVIGRYVYKQEFRLKKLEVHIVDKDFHSVLIRTPNDKRIIIDGGIGLGLLREVSELLPFYSKRIDVLIVTKKISNNISGLIDLISRYEVHEIVIPKNFDEEIRDKTFEYFINLAKDKNIPLKYVSFGDKMKIEDEIYFNILFPVDSKSFKYSKTSSPELLLELVYKETRIIFLNSATKKIQKFILENYNRISSNTALLHTVLVLYKKLSSTNTNNDFLKTINPEWIIYSSRDDVERVDTNFKDNKKNKEQYLINIEILNSKTKKQTTVISDGNVWNLLSK
jgi:beta-lactamase superfamily II metal-dependent hydrolase